MAMYVQPMVIYMAIGSLPPPLNFFSLVTHDLPRVVQALGARCGCSLFGGCAVDLTGGKLDGFKLVPNTALLRKLERTQREKVKRSLEMRAA